MDPKARIKVMVYHFTNRKDSICTLITISSSNLMGSMLSPRSQLPRRSLKAGTERQIRSKGIFKSQTGQSSKNQGNQRKSFSGLPQGHNQTKNTSNLQLYNPSWCRSNIAAQDLRMTFHSKASWPINCTTRLPTATLRNTSTIIAISRRQRRRVSTMGHRKNTLNSSWSGSSTEMPIQWTLRLICKARLWERLGLSHRKGLLKN